MMSRYCVFLLCLLQAVFASAQTEVDVETQITSASGSHNPLWLNANKYGLSSLDLTNGYVRAGLFSSVNNDTLSQWSLGYGADMALTQGFTSRMVVQQAYADVRWKLGLLTVGSKEQPMELKNQLLSSGPQSLGINARPVPGVRLSLPEYWPVPFARQWLAVKGHLFYGLTTDGNWQEDFIQGQDVKHTRQSKLHTKAGYLRIGKSGRPVSVELGLEMACQFGGDVYSDRFGSYQWIHNDGGLKGMFRALIPSGGETGEGIYANDAGNHLGSYLLRVNIDKPDWYAALYADHFFEDHSQMFFVDFDGYGKGDEFNKLKHNHWFIYELRDIMLGAELRLKHFPWMDQLVVEYLYTKYQSGPIYHDRTYNLSDHIAGRDDYYNNYMQSGWQHWGQVMGNPLYRSPLYNDDHQIRVENNRFWAWHVGVSGKPVKNLQYRLLATWQRGWGSYDNPFIDPQRNTSLLAEAEYQFQKQLQGWSVKAAFALDRGSLLGDNTGMQFTVKKNLMLKRR